MLEKIFKELKTPEEKQEDIFITELIFNDSHRIGKNYEGQPSILFNTKKKSQSINGYKGANIRLRFNINCNIHEKNKKIFKNYTILSCTSDDKKIIQIFLEVCETTFSKISSEPTTKEIKDITQSIIDLFKNMPNKRLSLIGLWGELFLITSSKNISKCLEAWHKHTEDKYDFYDNNEALEVKCTSKTDRKHEFIHDQLISDLSDHYIASVMTRENLSVGLDVIDLYKRILKKNLPIHLVDKLKKIYYKTIGKTSDQELNEYKYDYDFAKRNVLYFKVSELSKIENRDPAISNISYTVDLSQNQSVDSLSKNKFTSCLYFPGD